MIALPVNIGWAIVETGAVIACPLYCYGIIVTLLKEKKLIDGLCDARENKERV